ncbi:MAG TPA: peptide chain release factor N(5)-glutamine methyltransferase [Actinomycetota bacterium]|nr:peptide chain release factor N(5)-glutamine methyltransferase [Actinomycetota bacterium]
MEPTVREALRGATARLAGSVGSPAVDAEVLVGHVLGASRSSLFAAGDRALTRAQTAALGELVQRRCAGEPLQYLTGHQPFRTLDLLVGPGVLVPRPETEIVVEAALRHLERVAAPLVVDLGTGSGAIALSVAVERPGATVWATEISPEAVAWAERNLGVSGAANVTIVAGDLFAPLPPDLRGRFDLVVANPPYLTDVLVAAAAPDVRDHEPWVALVSGPTGLEVPGRVIDGAPDWLRPGGWLVMETWPGQADDLIELMGDRYRETGAVADLAGTLRAVEGRKP